MLILNRWSWRFWSLTRTTFTPLGAVTGLKQNQLKFKQQIHFSVPGFPDPPDLLKRLQSSRQAPSSSSEGVVSTQAEKCFRCNKALVLHILHGPPRVPVQEPPPSCARWGTSTSPVTVEHLMSSPSSPPKWSTLFKNKAFSNHLSLHLHALKNAYQAMNPKGKFLLKKASGSLTAEWAQLRF